MVTATRRAQREASEEAVAAARAVLGVTVTVGLMVGVMGAVNGQALALIALPALVLLGAILARWVPLAGWAGAVVWAALLPSAHAEAMLGPLVMIAICIAIAIGPDRFGRLIERDLLGQRGGAPDPDEGIEEL